MNKTFYILFGLFMLVALFSCSADDPGWTDPTDESPMKFEFLLPEADGTATRNKTTFVAGNKIYVTAEVTLDGSTEILSGILKYGNNGFEPEANSDRLMWPTGAISAKFSAYYLPDDPPPTPPEEDNPVTINMAKLSESGTNDDLLIARQESVGANGVAVLRFAHTTTKLRFYGLVASAKYIRLTYNGTNGLNNRITLNYSTATGYTHSFDNDGDDTGITIEKKTGVDDSNTTTSALFFLDVTDDWTNKQFTLTQYDGNEARAELKSTPLTDDGVNLHTMKKGRAYYISFYGGSVKQSIEEDVWYEPSETTLKFESAEQIVSYMQGRTSLEQDLDFNNILLDDPAIIFPGTRSITLGGNTFDGNNRTIRNIYVRNGLFGTIPAGATVKNLQLENIKVIADGVPAAGLLAPVNSGTIENVRIIGNNSLGTSDVGYVGALVGENRGTIKSVQLSGALAVEAYTDNTVGASGIFAVGALVGYNNGTVTDCEINAGGLLKAGGELTADAAIGGLVGYHALSKTISGCTTTVRVDATALTASNNYAGGFCGVNRGTLKTNEASGQVKGGRFTTRSATGGFVGYTTSLTEKTDIAVVNGCGAAGMVTEANPESVADDESQMYTGGFCGFSEIDLYNVWSVGNITPTGSTTCVRRQGSLTGLISAEKTIYNSFSITQSAAGDNLEFNGGVTCKTQNAHYRGYMLTEQGALDMGTTATVNRLNNAISTANGYWTWNASTTVYGGMAYLVKP